MKSCKINLSRCLAVVKNCSFWKFAVKELEDADGRRVTAKVPPDFNWAAN